MRLPAIVVGLWIGLAARPALAQSPPPPPAPPAYTIVIHPENRAERLSRSFLANAFLKKTTRWGDSGTIRPVDLPIGSSVRRKFVEQVLRRSIAAIRSYWQQIIFSGRGLPPVELEDDAAVLRYVRGHRGAIGYVSGGARLEGVRVVRVE